MKLPYLDAYPQQLQSKIKELMCSGELKAYILNKYPNRHIYQTDKSLYSYTLDIKNNFMKKSSPLSKVHYDGKIHVVSHALGTHTFISRVQGGKLKAKNEIRIASVFKAMPEEFLRMIVIHELAHFKEKEHNKAFYKLCSYMDSTYHQLEFDTRVYLSYVDNYGTLYHNIHK